MVNRAKAKGSLAERQVADYLINAGIPCERIPAGATHDRGDLWVPLANFPSIDVKNQKQMTLAGWVDWAGEQAHNAARTAGVVWHKRAGKSSPGDWYVTCSGSSFVALMRKGN